MTNSDSPRFPFFDEAESVPQGQYRQYFVEPPELKIRPLTRSCLISGSLGAGKTMLLRTLAEQHGQRGIDAKVNLLSTLQGRLEQTSVLAEDPNNESIISSAHLVQSKCAALVALRIGIKILKEEVRLSPAIRALLPPTLVNATHTSDFSALRNLQAIVEQTPINAFGGPWTHYGALVDYVSEQAAICALVDRPLALFLDRAEFFTAIELAPLVGLLQKPEGYSAYITMRPGTRVSNPLTSPRQVVSGDDYDLLHLGSFPRSDGAKEFVHDLLDRQLPGYRDRVKPDALALIHHVARDSIRYMVKFMTAYLREVGRSDHQTAMAAVESNIEHERRQLISAINGNLANSYSNFVAALMAIGSNAREQGNGFLTGPVILLPQYQGGTGTRRAPTTYEETIALGLRHSALALAAGEIWNPETPASRVEISPLLLWRRGDPQVAPGASDLEFGMTERLFRQTFRQVTRHFKIFFGFKFSAGEVLRVRK